MNDLLQCDDCGWMGLEGDCGKKARGIYGTEDVELYPVCPKCDSPNLIELDSKGAVLEPCLA